MDEPTLHLDIRKRMPMWYVLPLVGIAVCLDIFEFAISALIIGVSLGFLSGLTTLLSWGIIAFFVPFFWLLFKLRGVTMVDRFLAKLVLSGLAIVAQSVPFIGFLMPGWTIWVLGTVLMTRHDDKVHNKREEEAAVALQESVAIEQTIREQEEAAVIEQQLAQQAAVQQAIYERQAIQVAANNNQRNNQRRSNGQYDGVARRNLTLRPSTH